ncbi:fimbrial protein [Enterobacter sichuanensis]|uniref:fimbrial protein n=1 Tax=Enterobacter sichuanensis TaxID=2071710 RepID=UPI002DBDEE4B|nr:fimbrial protein [Enterobacter sichuanensis]MEB5959741.1 fimbrial protein [Enterobacter sichuanensis]
MTWFNPVWMNLTPEMIFSCCVNYSHSGERQLFYFKNCLSLGKFKRIGVCIMKIFLKLVFLIVALSFGHCAYAYCHPNNESPNIKFNLNFDTVIVPQGAAPGTLIAEQKASQPVTPDWGCAPDYTLKNTYLVGSDTGLKYKNCTIYSTNIPGIGYALQGDHGGSASSNLCNDSHYHYPETFSNPGGGFYPAISVSMMLFVTGNAKSGTLSTGEYGRFDYGQETMFNGYTVSLTSGAISALSCSLSASNINVSIGDIPVDVFKGVGSVSPSADFDIGLTCNRDANVSVSLNGTHSSETSDNSVIALTDTGKQASGIGVQILNNGTPLDIGSSVPLKTIKGNSLVTLPFSARYYQTSSKITAGNANTTATLDIIYQ